MRTAKKICDLDDWAGDASVYELDPPFEYEDYDGHTIRHIPKVIVSSVVAPFSGSETMVFVVETTDNGAYTTDFHDIGVVYELSHEKMLSELGYIIV